MRKILFISLLFYLLNNLASAENAPYSSSNCRQHNYDASDLLSFLNSIKISASSKPHRTIAELLMKRLRSEIDEKENIPNDFLLICNSQGYIAAVANYNLESSKFRKHLFLDYLLALPKGSEFDEGTFYRGGAGSAAMQHLAVIAVRANKRGIATEPAPSAVGFYREQGFKRIAATKNNEEFYLLTMRKMLDLISRK